MELSRRLIKPFKVKKTPTAHNSPERDKFNSKLMVNASQKEIEKTKSMIRKLSTINLGQDELKQISSSRN